MCVRVCVVTDVALHRCLMYTTFSPLQGFHRTMDHISRSCGASLCLYGRLLRISELVVVSGVVVEQQRIADLEQQWSQALAANRLEVVQPT